MKHFCKGQSRDIFLNLFFFFYHYFSWWAIPDGQNLRGLITNLGNFLSCLYKFIFYSLNVHHISKGSRRNPSHYRCFLSIMINRKWCTAKAKSSQNLLNKEAQSFLPWKRPGEVSEKLSKHQLITATEGWIPSYPTPGNSLFPSAFSRGGPRYSFSGENADFGAFRMHWEQEKTHYHFKHISLKGTVEVDFECSPKPRRESIKRPM